MTYLAVYQCDRCGLTIQQAPEDKPPASWKYIEMSDAPNVFRPPVTSEIIHATDALFCDSCSEFLSIEMTAFQTNGPTQDISTHTGEM